MKNVFKRGAASWRTVGQAVLGFTGLFGSSLVAVEEASVKIDVKESAPVPVYYSAVVAQRTEVGSELISHTAELSLKVIQGEAETFSFEVLGGGKIIEVNALGEDSSYLKSWATRQGEQGVFLDLAVKADAPELRFQVRAEQELADLPQEIWLWNLGTGEAIAFDSSLVIKVAAGTTAEFEKLLGHTPERQEKEQSGWEHLLGAGPVSRKLVSTTGGRISLAVRPAGVPSAQIELLSASLTGGIDEANDAAAFVLRGELVAYRGGVELPLLSGNAAVTDLPRVAGLRFYVKNDSYYVEALEKGRYLLSLPFVAKVTRGSDYRALDFITPSTTVLPLDIAGLQEVTFSEARSVRPVLKDGIWQGFVPASGEVSLAWKSEDVEKADSLFFSSESVVDIRVGAGLLRQDTSLKVQVLQGQLEEIFFETAGAGEILSVEGVKVLSWDREEGGLRVRLREAEEKELQLLVRSQVPLEGLPTMSTALRLSPANAVRHAGFLRLRNEGSVRLSLEQATGLLQLAPEEFPNEAVSARQQFVYRFPTADYNLTIAVDQISPEVSVTETLVYELGESERRIRADIELDIREAGLREWQLQVPAEYSVVSVSGAQVADYVVASEAVEGLRPLRVIFAKELIGRQLVKIDLEKSDSLAPEEWSLPSLIYQDAKAVRGTIGVVAEPGIRLAITSLQDVVEKPLSIFPKQTKGLQLAFRIRERSWSAKLQVERLPRSIEADVFHLYALKDGTAFGSVVVNYFVTGSPVDEWRLSVPPEAGNVAIDGQNVRSWRREEDLVIVTLQQPVIGLYTLLLTCEEPVGSQQGTVQPGRVQPLGTRGERGYLQIVSSAQVNSQLTNASENLLKLDALELPAEFRLASSAPSLASFQYTKRPFALTMDVEWFAPGETVAQVVEFAEAESRISRDGEVVTDAIYQVKTRGERILRLDLPAETRLWEVRVAGEAVNARADGSSTLVPLPADADANKTLEVKVRYGQSAGDPRYPKLTLPVVAAPVLKTEWRLQGDERRRLLLREKGKSPWQSGWGGASWIVSRALGSVGCLVLLVILMATFGRRSRVFGVLLAVVAFAILAILLVTSAYAPSLGRSSLEIGVPVLSAGETVAAEVSNLATNEMRWSLPGFAFLALGVVVFGVGLFLKTAFLRFLGLLVAGGTCLWMPGGAFWFFALFAVLLVGMAYQMLRRGGGGSSSEDEDSSGGHSAAAATVLLALAFLLFSSQSILGEVITSGDSLRQQWTITEERLVAEGEMVCRGEIGDQFYFLKDSVTLENFEGRGLRLSKDDGGYLVTFITLPPQEEEAENASESVNVGKRQPENKRRTFTFSYQMQVPESAVSVPTAPAAVNTLQVTLDQANWAIDCETAAQVTQEERADGSAAEIILLPRSDARVVMKPRERDPLQEETAFFVEVSNAYLPGLGLLEGYHRVEVNPSQGVVRELKLTIPEGLAVTTVEDGPVANWRFSAELSELTVELQDAPWQPFSFQVITQKSLGALPLDLAVEPVRVLGGEREVGTMGIAFRGKTQAEGLTAEGLLEVNLADFQSELIKDRSAVLHRAYRYREQPAELALQLVAVEPEVRVVTEETLSLGAERTLYSVNARLDVARAGIFNFRFPIPAGFEVESLSGAEVSHWDESGEGEQGEVTVHLNGQTIGQHDFFLVFVKASTELVTSEGDDWTAPRFAVQEAARQSGRLIIRTEQGIRLRTLARQGVSEVDPQALATSNKNSPALAYRLLQKDWRLRFGIEELEPWITGQLLQELTLREGQTRHVLLVTLQIENAAVRRVSVRIPGLGEEVAKTLRASGSAVSGISPVAGEDELWEVSFKRRVIGRQDLRIEWERTGERDEGKEQIVTPQFPELRQVSSYLALWAGAQLEVEAGGLSEGWYRLDWSAVPMELRDVSQGGIPALTLRSGEGVFGVQVARHAVAEALKLRVSEGSLTTVVSPKGDLFTAVKLQLEVIQRSPLRIAFEETGELFNVFVNGESVNVVRDGANYQFYVVPGIGGDTAEVEFAYAVDGQPGHKLSLQSPEISVPLENIEWRVIVPERYGITDVTGDLDLEESIRGKSFGKMSYVKSIETRALLEKEKAQETFEKADEFLSQGLQAEALQLYQNVANNYNLDEATNEDARVKLNRVQTEQVVAGLNSRRQRVYLENQIEEAVGFRNSQLELAASSNTILLGEVNFRPDELDALLVGNSVEENEFLRRIADRLVRHQKATEPAPQAISVPIPEEGREFVFRRTVRVDEDKPLVLGMVLQEANEWAIVEVVIALSLLAILAGSFAFGIRRERSR